MLQKGGSNKIVTNLAPVFSLAANEVFARTGDAVVKIPNGFDSAVALDFASSPMAWAIYHLTTGSKIIGPIILSYNILALMIWNRIRIIKEIKMNI